MWQRPLAGRLVGAGHASGTPLGVGLVAFIDNADQSWNLTITDLSERGADLIKSGKRVRVLIATSSVDGVELTHACAVFPWIMDHPPMIGEFRSDRVNFIEGARRRQMEAADKAKKVGEAIKSTVAGEPVIKNGEVDSKLPPSGPTETIVTSFSPGSPCANLALFKKIKFAE